MGNYILGHFRYLLAISFLKEFVGDGCWSFGYNINEGAVALLKIKIQKIRFSNLITKLKVVQFLTNLLELVKKVSKMLWIKVHWQLFQLLTVKSS